MQFRKFGNTDWMASALGFGCMRLPTLGGSQAIDEPEAIRMIRFAIDAGVNYVDTAYPYHGGRSEVVLGKALDDGYRKKVKLATKLPAWLVNDAKDFDRLFNEQRRRLKTDRVDLYLLHSLNHGTWNTIHDLNVLEWAEQRIAEGTIGWLGFSFHDEYPVFTKIVDAYDGWKFCQIQYNYMDEEFQAGSRGLHYASEKGLAVVVMEPIKGGNLADPPQSIRSMLDASPVRRSSVDWALQWIWNQPEASVVLSGMSTMQQVEENIRSAEVSRVGLLDSTELDSLAHAAAAWARLNPIPCTRCRYCMPCPSGVDIPRNLGIYNSFAAYGRRDLVRLDYSFVPRKERASACTACRQCEDKCPQSIAVHDWMERIVKEIESR